jgi:chromate transport protein ChrA
MKPKFSENPREWRAFGLSSALAFSLILAFLFYRGALPWTIALVLGLAPITLAATAWCCPRQLRRFYRGGMTLGSWIGTVVGSVLLALAFILVVVPLSLLIRMLRQDPLGLRRRPSDQSYWHAAPPASPLDRSF